MQAFFHETVAASGRSYDLFASLGTVRDFLTPGEPCSFERLVVWLRVQRERLSRDLRAWIPSYSHDFGKPIASGSLVERLIGRLEAELPIVRAPVKLSSPRR